MIRIMIIIIDIIMMWVYCRKPFCLEKLAYCKKPLISNELNERKKVGDREEKIEVMWAKRRQIIIQGHGRWLDENT